MSISLRRREFIAALSGAAAWPLAVRAQQGGRVRRIGVLMPGDENDPLWKPRLSAFTQALADLGWTDGRNVRTDLRWGRADINRTRALAQELVGLKPDIILANGAPTDPDSLCERGRPRRRVARPKVGSRLRFAASATFGGSRRQTIRHALGIA